MRRNLYLFLIIILFGASFWIGKTLYYDPLPDKLIDLEYEQTRYNEKLITAQILAEKMDRVYTIFEHNLATRTNDVRSEAASMEFLNTLTNILDSLEIKVLHIQPRPKEPSGKVLYIPYELEIECTYEQFGKFITELEKNERLITLEEFTLNNGLERLSAVRDPQQLMKQNIELKISTITLNKTRG